MTGKPFTLNHPLVAIDRSVTPNRLYASDTLNNRILGWNSVETLAEGQPADLVIGQPDFVATGCNDGIMDGDSNGLGPDSLCFPFGIAIDHHGNLYVADADNHRVLEYDSPFSICSSFPCVGPVANVVWGQGGDFTTAVCSQGVTMVGGSRLALRSPPPAFVCLPP